MPRKHIQWSHFPLTRPATWLLSRSASLPISGGLPSSALPGFHMPQPQSPPSVPWGFFPSANHASRRSTPNSHPTASICPSLPDHFGFLEKTSPVSNRPWSPLTTTHFGRKWKSPPHLCQKRCQANITPALNIPQHTIHRVRAKATWSELGYK